MEQAVNHHGLGKWSQVAQMLAPRTDNQCWRRWKALHQDELEDYRQTIQKKRNGMVNNFVGREKERPELTADDIASIHPAVSFYFYFFVCYNVINHFLIKKSILMLLTLLMNLILLFLILLILYL